MAQLNYDELEEFIKKSVQEFMIGIINPKLQQINAEHEILPIEQVTDEHGVWCEYAVFASEIGHYCTLHMISEGIFSFYSKHTKSPHLVLAADYGKTWRCYRSRPDNT